MTALRLVGLGALVLFCSACLVGLALSMIFSPAGRADVVMGRCVFAVAVAVPVLLLLGLLGVLP